MMRRYYYFHCLIMLFMFLFMFIVIIIIIIIEEPLTRAYWIALFPLYPIFATLHIHLPSLPAV